MAKDTVTVCDRCLRATCWHGNFMCDDAKNAGTVEKTVDELRKLNLENPCYWTQKGIDDLNAFQARLRR